MNTVEQRPNSLSLSFVEGLYADYVRNAESVSPDWRRYFDELTPVGTPNGNGNGAPKAVAVDAAPGASGDGANVKLEPCSQRQWQRAYQRRRRALGFRIPPQFPTGDARSRHAAADLRRRRPVGRAGRRDSRTCRRSRPAARSGRSVGAGLSRARASRGRSRSARIAAARIAGTRSADSMASPRPTWIGPSRPTRSRGRGDDAAADPRAAAQHLLPLDRRAVHAHGRSDGPPMAARADGRLRKPAARSAARSNCGFSLG